MKKTKGESKPKFLLPVNKQTKLSVDISQKTADLITDYQTFLKKFSAAELGIDALVNAFISSAITSDKAFIKWKKDIAEEAAKEVAKSQSENSGENKEAAKSQSENSGENNEHQGDEEKADSDVS